MNTPHTSKTRLDVVDALRGFAVFAILLVHSQEHFMFFSFPDAVGRPDWLNLLDKNVHDVVFALFAGKSYSIFALLFGLTFYIQQHSQEKKGKDFGYRFLWRIFWLIGFAFLNALVFPGGDVLLLYCIVAPLLFFVRKWNSSLVMALAVLLLIQPIEWGFFLAGYTETNLINGPLWGEVYDYTAHGTLSEFLLGNLGVGQKASLIWAVENGRFLQTGGLFLLGYLAGRHRRFEDTESNRNFWRNILVISALLYVPFITINQSLEKSYPYLAFDMWTKLSLTFVIVAGFVLSYWNVAKFRSVCTPLRSYGRMSLTNYLSQSYLGALLFFPFGLNLAPVCGMTVSLFIGFGIFFVQIIFCNLWFKHHTIGPLEGLWHRLTWLRSNQSSVVMAKR